jgi:hypothetical protein
MSSRRRLDLECTGTTDTEWVGEKRSFVWEDRDGCRIEVAPRAARPRTRRTWAPRFCNAAGEAWADEHRSEIQNLPTYFLNLDGLAFGPPRFLGREIPLVGLPQSYPTRILAICSQLAAERGLVDAGPHSVAGFTDGLPFLVRGVPGVTVVGTRDDGRLPLWHLQTDDIQRMDFDAAWRSVEFASRLMPRLAALT